jgi:glutamate carboxypeptidase
MSVAVGERYVRFGFRATRRWTEMTMADLVDRAQLMLPLMIDDLEALVTCESPSADLDAVAASAEVVARVGAARLGAEPERIVLDGRTHLRWRLGAGPSRVLVLGHHDTVWPLGTLATHPFTITDGVVRGPGCFDMKAGVVMAFHAIAALGDPSGVTMLVTGDEEVGSPTSRALIEAEASGCAAALVLEASADGGALKIERKGVSLYEMRVTGRAAHAGLEPERGVNATIELAHQVLAITALSDGGRGTTVTPTLMSAGTTSNTVPQAGLLTVDVRVREVADQERVDAAMRALQPVLAGALLEVTGGPNRPPLERAASADLFDRAVNLAAQLGLSPVAGASVGGASDGNFTAAVGTPTLDGLGAVGGGAHADDEHVLLAELPRGTALLAALIDELLDAGRPSRVTSVDNSSGANRP